MSKHEFAGNQLERRGPPGEPGLFLRVVRYGHIVYVRRGARGSQGALVRTEYPTVDEASMAAANTVQSWKQHPSLPRAMFSTGHGEPVSLSDPEAEFLARWTTSVQAEVLRPDRPRTTWVLATGLVNEASRNYGAAQLLAALQAGPCAIDTPTGNIVATSVSLPDSANSPFFHDGTLRGVGFGVRLHHLAPRVLSCAHGSKICSPCATRQAELLAYLVRDIDPRDLDGTELARLASTANRLALAGSR